MFLKTKTKLSISLTKTVRVFPDCWNLNDYYWTAPYLHAMNAILMVYI